MLAKPDTTIRLGSVLVTSKAFYSTEYVALVTTDYECSGSWSTPSHAVPDV